MQRIALFALGFCVFIPLSPADVPATKSYPTDLHDHDRAIAFGSALMVTDGGRDQRSWKKVDTWLDCGSKPSEPSKPTEPPPHGEAGETPNPGHPLPSCSSSVLFVTQYHFVECPDGRAYILRSGEGVTVIDAGRGEFFAWGEGAACGIWPVPSPEPIPLPEPIPTPGSAPEKSNVLDKDRALDFSRIVKIPG